MSMNNYANFGYTLPIMDLAKFMTAEQTIKLKQLVDECDTDEIGEFLSSVLPEPIRFPEILRLNDECESFDLEIGEIYACWYEEDLFVKTPTDMNLFLTKMGAKPEAASWVTYG